MQPMSEMSPSELTVLRQISDTLVSLNSRMEGMEGGQRETLQRLVRLEERSQNTAKLEQRIEKIDAALSSRMNNHSDRIQSLEADRHRIEGASNVALWLNRLWPIFAAGIGVVGVFLGFKG